MAKEQKCKSGMGTALGMIDEGYLLTIDIALLCDV